MFSTSHTCHMWRISDFSTSVMWRHLKFLHMWRNFQFPHDGRTWKAEISSHENFFSRNIIRDIRDKYELCSRTGCVRWKPCAPFSLSHPESLNTLWCFHLITLLCIQNRFEEWLEHFKCFKFNNCITWSKNQWIRYLTYHCFRQISAGNGYPNSVNDFNFSENNSTIHASDPLKHLNPANHLGGWVHVC